MKTHNPRPQTAAQLIVTGLSAAGTAGLLTCGNLRFPCSLGRSGRKAEKREGDGATPVGSFLLRRAYYRPDRLRRPRTLLPLVPLRPADGWCDEPGDPNYNRFVSHPYPASAERLWRSDRLYDLILVMGYNDHPRVRGRGSAVFMHVARDDLGPTAGCVALRLPDLLQVIARVSRATSVRILG